MEEKLESPSVKMEIVAAIQVSIRDLSMMLEGRISDVQGQCGKINNLLRQEPAAAALLTEQEIGQFMQAHYQLARIEWNAAPASKNASKKALDKALDAAVDFDNIVI